MIALQWLMFAAVVVVAFLLVGRLRLMSWRTTTALILLMHMGMLISAIWTGYRAWNDEAEIGGLAAVVAAACWLAISRTTWRDGVPERFTKPADLDDGEMMRVGGGRK